MKEQLRRIDHLLFRGNLARLYRKKLKYWLKQVPKVKSPDRFPPFSKADENGLIAYGDTVNGEWMLKAYEQGIFPYYYPEEPVLWWAPRNRGILRTGQFHLQNNMIRFLKKKRRHVTFDHSFDEVVRQCRDMRPDEMWLDERIVRTYADLHGTGHAHSVETWDEGRLVGGLFGVVIGHYFSIESMFSLEDQASKIAMTVLAQQFLRSDDRVIDTQFPARHFLEWGALEMPREEYMPLIEKAMTCAEVDSFWESVAGSEFSVSF